MAGSRVRKLATRDAVTMLEEHGLPGEALTAQLARSLADTDDYTFVAKLVDRLEYLIDLAQRAEEDGEDEEEASEEEEEEEEEQEDEKEKEKEKKPKTQTAVPTPTPTPEPVAEAVAKLQRSQVPEAALPPPSAAQQAKKKRTLQELLAEARV